MDLDNSKEFVAALELSVFCTNLSDATAYPDGQHCKTKKPVEIDDAESVVWEVLSIYRPFEKEREAMIFLDLALQNWAKVVVGSVERVGSKINLVKPFI